MKSYTRPQESSGTETADELAEKLAETADEMAEKLSN